jgi:hypothetical protein
MESCTQRLSPQAITPMLHLLSEWQAQTHLAFVWCVASPNACAKKKKKIMFRNISLVPSILSRNSQTKKNPTGGASDHTAYTLNCELGKLVHSIAGFEPPARYLDHRTMYERILYGLLLISLCAFNDVPGLRREDGALAQSPYALGGWIYQQGRVRA